MLLYEIEWSFSLRWVFVDASEGCKACTLDVSFCVVVFFFFFLNDGIFELISGHQNQELGLKEAILT
jgi:sulfur relay (sulfurtransferase) DsrF/TusC family protein